MIDEEQADRVTLALHRLSVFIWDAAYSLGRVEKGEGYWASNAVYKLAVLWDARGDSRGQ